MPPQHAHHPEPNTAPKTDPTKSSKTWAIALIASTIFLLAAAGVVTWLVLTRSNPNVTTTITTPPDDTKGVKNATFVAPTSLPATFAKTDQSKIDATTNIYAEDPLSCAIITHIAGMPAGKSPKDVATEAITSTQTSGVTTTQTTQVDAIKIKNADGATTYTFDASALAQTVDVKDVGFTGQRTTIAYKQFGNQIVAIAYTCKNEAADEKKTEAANIVAAFTVKTER